MNRMAGVPSRQEHLKWAVASPNPAREFLFPSPSVLSEHELLSK